MTGIRKKKVIEPEQLKLPMVTPKSVMAIKGVVIQETGLYMAAPYEVIVGWIESDTNKDIPHYLIVNTITGVVEGSSTRLFEARGICQAYQKELNAQDDMIFKQIDLVEKVEEPDGNTDPKYRKRNWKSH